MASLLRDTTRGLAKDVVEPVKETTSAVDNVLENLISGLWLPEMRQQKLSSTSKLTNLFSSSGQGYIEDSACLLL